MLLGVRLRGQERQGGEAVFSLVRKE
jgi:hypothetical protein